MIVLPHGKLKHKYPDGRKSGLINSCPPVQISFFEVFAVGPGKEKEWAGMEKDNDSDEGWLELGTRGG